QNTVALSTTEAEYMAITEAIQETTWPRERKAQGAADSAHARLEEVLRAQETVLEEKRQALEALAKEKRESKKLLESHIRVRALLQTTKERFSRFREREASRVQKCHTPFP
ncbi:hypothetical protein CFOL_v3_13406, partial [Cephalotus follicularis]